MALTPQEKAQSLLDAQVKFFLQDLTPERLKPILEQEMEYLYEKLSDISLNQAVQREKVSATAHRYAIEMEIGGAIPELFGEVARIIYELPSNDDHTLGDIINDDIVEDFLEKIFETDSLLDQAVNSFRQSEPFRSFLSDVAFTVIKSYLMEENKIVKSSPTVARGLRAFTNLISNRTPALRDLIEDQSRSALQGTINTSLEMVQNLLDNDLYRDNYLNSTILLWDDVKEWPVGYFKNYFTELDLQELLVLGYEFWLDFRHTDYLQSCIDAGVNFFFDKYGDESLQTVISDMGVTKEMIFSEHLRYVPDLAELLIKEDIAETILRRHLHRFYFDETTLKLLA